MAKRGLIASAHFGTEQASLETIVGVPDGNLKTWDFGNLLRLGSRHRSTILGTGMPKSTSKSKPALDTLVESVTRIRAEAKERMSEDEFRQVEEKFHQLANKVRASRPRQPASLSG